MRTSAGAVPKRTPGTDNRVLLVCRLLNEHRVRYLIAGGVAANLHGSVRATKDVDVLVPPDVANMARLLDALSALPWGIARALDPAELAARPITIIGDDPRVDVLTVAWSVTFKQAWPRRRMRRIDGLGCRSSRSPTSGSRSALDALPIKLTSRRCNA